MGRDWPLMPRNQSQRGGTANQGYSSRRLTSNRRPSSAKNSPETLPWNACKYFDTQARIQTASLKS